MDGGDAILQAAADLGAEYIFSSAGSEWAPVWEALARRDAAGAGTARRRRLIGFRLCPTFFWFLLGALKIGLQLSDARIDPLCCDNSSITVKRQPISVS